jgi:uncharacterized DUF497 family protein
MPQFDGLDRDSGNLPKCLGHGVSMAEIEALFAGDIFIVSETIIDDEQRMLGFGEVSGRWIFCVFTQRGPRIRPISVRYMHEKEVKRYVEEISRSAHRQGS